MSAGLTRNCGRGSSMDSAGVSRVPHLKASSASLLFQRSRKSVAQMTLKRANTTQQMSWLFWVWEVVYVHISRGVQYHEQKIFKTLDSLSEFMPHLICLWQHPQQQANDRRIKHGVGVETQPRKVHSDLHPKISTYVIWKWKEKRLIKLTLTAKIFIGWYQRCTRGGLHQGVVSHTQPEPRRWSAG